MISNLFSFDQLPYSVFYCSFDPWWWINMIIKSSACLPTSTTCGSRHSSHSSSWVCFRSIRTLSRGRCSVSSYGRNSLVNSAISLLLAGFNETVSAFLWRMRYPSLTSCLTVDLILLPSLFTFLLSQRTREPRGVYLPPQQPLFLSLSRTIALTCSSVKCSPDIVHL